MVVEQYVKYYKNYIMRPDGQISKTTRIIYIYGHTVCPKVYYIDMDTIL